MKKHTIKLLLLFSLTLCVNVIADGLIPFEIKPLDFPDQH